MRLNLNRRRACHVLPSSLLLLVLCASGAFATSIPITGVTATTTMGECCGKPLVNIVNGSGLSSYDPSASHDADAIWISTAKTGTITFTLPGSYLLGGLAVWNTAYGVKDFTLETSTDGISFNPIAGFSASLANVPSGGVTNSEAYTFSPVQASYARMVISSGYSVSNNTGLKEVMFLETSAVPEPETFGLLGISLLGIAAATARRRRTKLGSRAERSRGDHQPTCVF